MMNTSKSRTMSSEAARKTSSHSIEGVIVVDDDDDYADKSTRFLERSSSTRIAAMKERRVSRGLELQQQLGQAQKELKKVRDQLRVSEEEKSKVLDELEQVKKVADDTALRLREALVAKKQADDGWEMEKVHSRELEQATIESAEKRDRAWQLELETVQRQHALDMETLSSVEQELIHVNNELSLATMARNEAIKEAADARIVADANRKRVSELSMELDLVMKSCGSSSRNSNTKLEKKEANGMSRQIAPMTESLKHDFGISKEIEAKLDERQALTKNLKLESDAEGSKMQAVDSLAESKMRIEMLVLELEKAKESEAKTFELLISQTKKLEETTISLEEAKFEIASLLDVSIDQSGKNLNASRQCPEIVKLDIFSAEESIKTLQYDLQTAKEDLDHVQERDSCSSAEEVSILRNELKLATEAEENCKKAMDGLAMALKEVNREAKQAKENLASTQSELENANMEIKNLNMMLKRTEENFQALLDEAMRERDDAKAAAERLRLEAEVSNDAWNGKEAGFIQCMKLSEEEMDEAKEENGILIESLMKAEEVAKKATDESRMLRDILKQAVNEANVAKEAAEIARTENSLLKDNLSDLSSVLERIAHDNEQLKINEAAALEQVKVLKNLLSATPNKEPGASKKTNMPIEESKDSKKMAKSLVEQSKKVSKNDGAEPDLLKGSIFDMVEVQDDISPSIKTKPSHKAFSSLLTSDGEMSSSFHFGDIDGSHFDDMGNDRIPRTKQRKKTLVHRFGDLLKRRTNIRS